MRVDELKGMEDAELAQAETNAAEDLFRLRFQHHTGQLTNTAELKETRRQLARIKTLRKERTIAASKES
jgi:large subunit ribosomal protein L29